MLCVSWGAGEQRQERHASLAAGADLQLLYPTDKALRVGVKAVLPSNWIAWAEAISHG